MVDTNQILRELLGPTGLTVALILGIIWATRLLVQFVREYIADIKSQRDIALTGWAAQTDATNRVADLVLEERSAGKAP